DAETGRCQSWNDEFLEFIGLAPEQILGKTAVELGLWSRATNKRIVSRRLSEEGSVRQLECRMRRKEGDRFLLVNMEHVDLDGRDSLLTKLVDISSHKRLEQTLRLTAAAVEHSGDALVILDARGQIVSVNPAFTRITGYTADDAQGKAFDKLLSESAGTYDEALFRSLTDSLRAQGHWEGEVDFRTGMGSDIPVLL